MLYLSRVAYRSHRVISPMVKKVHGKFFSKTTATRGRKLECAYSAGHWAQRHTALIACELARYNIDIVVLSENRHPEEGFHEEVRTGCTFFYSVLPKDTCHIYGVLICS